MFSLKLKEEEHLFCNFLVKREKLIEFSFSFSLCRFTFVFFLKWDHFTWAFCFVLAICLHWTGHWSTDFLLFCTILKLFLSTAKKSCPLFAFQLNFLFCFKQRPVQKIFRLIFNSIHFFTFWLLPLSLSLSFKLIHYLPSSIKGIVCPLLALSAGFSWTQWKKNPKKWER